MAKVFRLHKGTTDTITDWQASSVLGSSQISEIQDPEGGNAKKEITSIPSPFARIDLVKTAFEEIVNNNDFDLDGRIDGDERRATIYHKMVSDSLDVGEIFFNINKLNDKFEILYWDKTEDLAELLQSSNSAHKTVGETIDMFLKQDSDPNPAKDAQMYNFNKLHRVYMLNYVGPGKPSQLNIVGATSPCTLFFSTANNLDYVSSNVSFGQDKPFDDEIKALYLRDFEYIKYLWAFKASYEGFSDDFKAVDEYFAQTYSRLDDHKKKILDDIDSQYIENYQQIEVADINNKVEILGHPLHRRQATGFVCSDFTIDTKIFQGKKPLVLPIESGNTYTSLFYVTENWSKTDKSPVFDNKIWSERRLQDGTEYPYLTISDFLSETIVRMPYELNSKHYFNGNITSKQSYLLPLTSLFFDFFSVEELMGQMLDGKKMIEMRENAGGVSVLIRIPITGKGTIKYIEYQRNYFIDGLVDLSGNKGALIDKRFGLGIMPLIQFRDNEPAHYRISLFDKGAKNIELQMYCNQHLVREKEKVERREKGDVCSVESYVIDSKIDRIGVQIAGVNNFILPKFKCHSGSAKFVFAVDFGTTNTHIEYSKDNAPSQSFNILSDDVQLQRLHLDYGEDNGDIGAGFEDNFIPRSIGNNEIYQFPIRTAFAEYSKIDYDRATYALANGNIPFRYEKAPTPRHNDVKTELKWSTQKKEQVKLFLDNIYILLRNKVLLGGGSLSDTKIIWFYPASMTEAQCNNFKKIWHDLYLKYFGSELTNVISMSESVAPYSYYTKKQGAKQNVVTIDIGGGTTDVYVVENKEPKILSSFRFASNALFGDGYNWDSDNNGFVKLFKKEFKDSFSKNGLYTLDNAFDTIESRKNSSDITAFFFALSQNHEIKSKGIPSLNFLDKLQDNEQLKYVFVIFYSAILYYVATIMKAKKLEMPLTIAFSGNGSKTLAVLSSENDTLTKYMKLIFESVYGQKYDKHNDLEIRYDANPKESTCKGGILNPEPQDFDNIENIKCSLLGINSSEFTAKSPIDSVNEKILQQVVGEVDKFIDFVFTMNRENDGFFVKKFNADARISEDVRDICRRNLMEYAKQGLDNRVSELRNWGAEERVEETLFFMPIVGLLNNLARELSKL